MAIFLAQIDPIEPIGPLHWGGGTPHHSIGGAGLKKIATCKFLDFAKNRHTAKQTDIILGRKSVSKAETPVYGRKNWTFGHFFKHSQFSDNFGLVKKGTFELKKGSKSAIFDPPNGHFGPPKGSKSANFGPPKGFN